MTPPPPPVDDGTAPAPTPRVSWDYGTTFSFDDAEVRLENRVQFRFTDAFPPDNLQLPGTTSPGASKPSFAIRRAKTQLSGFLGWKELTYELQIGWAVTDLGLEHARVRELYSAITRTHKRFGPPLCVDAPAQRAGHLGAAALPLALGFMAMGFRHGFAPAPIGLALAASDQGERAAILVGSP